MNGRDMMMLVVREISKVREEIRRERSEITVEDKGRMRVVR